MTLQTMIVPEEKSETYFRGGEVHKDKILLSAGETLSFDTYFNSFSYSKYRDYTMADGVEFVFDFCGEVSASLWVFDGEDHFLCEKTANGKERSSLALSVAFAGLPQNGFLYAKIFAKRNSEFLSGEYRTECKYQPIRCCVAICTYRREAFVLKNIELLRSRKLTGIDRVFVIDNGKTLDALSLSDSFIRVLPNKNCGGSGGFTRGLIEAEQGGYSHIILMDDDVKFHPETLEQMTIFLSILKAEWSESWFSAAMITLDNPKEQYEMGAKWDGKTANKKAIVQKHKIKIEDREALLKNLENPEVQYGGWWTMLMPVSIVKKIGLPLPFFIKFDDVEYGIRKPVGTEIITMNGIAVYHEAFDRKTSFVLDYYNLRNELIVNCIYADLSLIGALKRIWHELLKEFLFYRYECCLLVFRAVEDFLCGVDFFLETDAEKEHKRRIRLVPKLVPLADLSQWNETLRCDAHKRSDQITIPMVFTAGGHLIPSCLRKKENYAVPLSRVSAADLFGRKSVIQYQLGKEEGLLTTCSFRKLIKYGFASLGMSVKFMLQFGRAKAQFQNRYTELSSLEFWRNYLELDSDGRGW